MVESFVNDEMYQKFLKQKAEQEAAKAKESNTETSVREEHVSKKIEKSNQKQDEFEMTLQVRMTRFLTWLFIIAIPTCATAGAYSVVQIIREISK